MHEPRFLDPLGASSTMMYASRHRHARWLPASVILATMILAASGCGNGNGSVSGTVTYQNKPVASGTVLIVGSDSLPYYSNIKEDGSYLVPKVPIGLAKIAVLSPGPDSFKDDPRQANLVKPGPERKARPRVFPGDPNKWFEIPPKYGDFQSSGLSLTVVGGLNEHDIPLD
jgi:hypothetical protein